MYSRIAGMFVLLNLSLSLLAGQTIALFQPHSLTAGPFPSDALSVSDGAQKTGIRINLPASGESCNPATSPSVCGNTTLLNQLDGFSVNPRLMVCFSAAVDPNTLQNSISIMPVYGEPSKGSPGPVVKINQILFDPASNCAFAKPDQVLNQQSRYLLIVMNSLQDSKGINVKADNAFQDCLKSTDPYCQELENAMDHIPPSLVSTQNIIAASLFTTMSATTWLEQARRYVDLHEPPVILPAGIPSSFDLAQLTSISWIPAQSGLPPQDIPLTALSNVGQVAFGFYLSPNFLDPTNGAIPTTPTNTPIAGPIPVPVTGVGIPPGFVPVSFHVFLPAGAPPPGGFPLVIYGHGLGDNQFGAPTFIASTLAKNGFATLAIEITGHGYGAGSVVNLTDSGGVVHTVATPGRGILLPGNTGNIGATDGCIAPGAIAVRDCGRQTAVDLFALIATIHETHGLGLPLSANQLYYVGQSFGSTYGTLLNAVEPTVTAAVLNGDGGTSVDVARISISGRPLGIEYLAPAGLLNVPPAPLEAYFHDQFNDNYVFRDNPPVINNVPGAMPIQAAFEAADWLGMLGDPLSYAPHLKKSPLAGVPQKSILFQFGFGDLEVSNPMESAVIRAANGQSSSWFFRLDQAAVSHPELLGVMMPGVPFPILPHRILSNPTIFDVPAETSLALAEQQQAASYFASGGRTIPNPNLFVTAPFSPAENLFQIPTALPEQLNFLQIAP
ncbi:MAG TPA: hypothetical protein VGG97_25135 [Bryobacteraceae bacterium]|jgi:hypothetical protein